MPRRARRTGAPLSAGRRPRCPTSTPEGEYDLAGTVVGVVEKAEILDGSRVERGDVLLGLPSTGLHTNGYSLARKVLFARHDVHDKLPALGGEMLGEALLRVHRSYLQPIQALIQAGHAHAFAHVTGGGIEGNLRRVIPGGLRAEVDYAAWTRPPLFRLIQEEGGVPEGDLRRTFNLGLGLVAVVPADRADEAERLLRDKGEAPVRVGSVVG